MEKVLLGKTGLEVSRLGIGLSEIGSSDEETSKEILKHLPIFFMKFINLFSNLILGRPMY